MSKPLTATALRSNLYRVLDEIATTGEPRAVTRGGRRFLIVPADAPGATRLWQRRKRKALRGISADALVATTFEYDPDQRA